MSYLKKIHKSYAVKAGFFNEQTDEEWNSFFTQFDSYDEVERDKEIPSAIAEAKKALKILKNATIGAAPGVGGAIVFEDSVKALTKEIELAEKYQATSMSKARKYFSTKK